MTATMRNAYLAVPHSMLSAHQRFRDARTAWLEVDIQLLRVIQHLSLIGAEPEATQARPRQTRASRTARYLYSHVSEPVTLRDMAAHVGVGVSTLCKEFREPYGTSPMKFLAEERMARARSLLESPDFRIQEIAALCGFASPQLFSRVFKAAHGVSPRACRAQR